MTTWPSLTMYSTSRWNSVCARSAWLIWCSSGMFAGSYSPSLPGTRWCPRIFALFGFDVSACGRTLLQSRDDAIDFVVHVRRLFGGPGDDEGRARFVDQNRVDFVDDREVVPALHIVLEVELHVVAQVVEPELVVRAVRDVARVGDLPLLIVEVVLNDTDRHAQEAVDAAHPLGVATGEIVVDGDDVNAFALECVEIAREGGDERLAFARLHLCYFPA